MNCVKCHNLISEDRLTALKILGKLPYEFTCLQCADNNKIKGIYNSGQLMIVNDVGQSGIFKDNSIQTTYDQ